MEKLVKKIKELLNDGDSKKLILTVVILLVIFFKVVSYSGIFSFQNKINEIDDTTQILDESDSKGDIKSSDNDLKNNKENKDSKQIVVYISGEVSTPSVVTINSDKRLKDAIDMAGGLTKNADTERINLALKLEDSQHYIIPTKGDNTSINQDTQNSNDSSNTAANEDLNGNSNKKININSADQSELDKIPGVGESTAKKILEYRKENGNFKSIEDIKNVSGIGDKKFESMKDYISI